MQKLVGLGLSVALASGATTSAPGPKAGEGSPSVTNLDPRTLTYADAQNALQALSRSVQQKQLDLPAALDGVLDVLAAVEKSAVRRTRDEEGLLQFRRQWQDALEGLLVPFTDRVLKDKRPEDCQILPRIQQRIKDEYTHNVAHRADMLSKTSWALRSCG